MKSLSSPVVCLDGQLNKQAIAGISWEERIDICSFSWRHFEAKGVRSRVLGP